MPSEPLWKRVLRGLQERVSSTCKKEESATGQLLQQVPIFQALSGRERHEIEQMLYGPRHWRAGEAIIDEGAPGLGMYIVVSGQVRLTQRDDEGSEKQLATLTEGDFFGVQALVDESPRPASAYALQPCSLLVFCRPDLLDLLENNTELALKIVASLAQELAADVPELIDKLAVQVRNPERLLKEARRAGTIQ